MARRCVVYARISISALESVSIARQLASAEQYAAAHGWQVVGTFTDDGVSATHNRPEDRAGWRALLDSDQHYDAVIIWKIDRLARRISDFWDAVKVLQEREKSLVSISDNLDLSTTIGQIVAGVLAGFAQMEAEAISDRVAAARRHLLHAGRVPGGSLPYGWRSEPNPDGPGYVLVQDPDRIDYVRGMVERVQRGETIYSVVGWLDEVSAPLPQGRKVGSWRYATVERLLRNPILAGMLAYNPGNKTKQRGADVVRDERGLPVVDDSVAVMSVADWRAMVMALDGRDTAQSRPRALRSKTSALLSGLMWCGEHETPVRMHRGTTQGRPGYSCPQCYQVITRVEDHVVRQFLWAKGERVRWSVVEEVEEGGSALLPEIEQRLDELDQAIRAMKDRDARRRLQDEQSALLDLREEKRLEAPRTVLRPVRDETRTYGEDWAAAADLSEQRAVLDDALDRIVVRRGRTGRGLDTSRLTFAWKFPEEVGPIAEPDDATLAAWAAE